MSAAKVETSQPLHVLLYPFPSSGHTIPALHLTHHLLCRNFTVTVLLLPSTATLLDSLLPLFPSSLHTLLLHPDPLPFNAPTHKQDLFAKMFALRDLDPQIISWFRSHPSPPAAVISDFFLGWTNKLASQLGIKRLVFSPSGGLALNIMNSLWLNRPDFTKPSVENPLFFSFPQLPNSPSYPASHLSDLYPEVDAGDEEWNSFTEFWSDNMASHGFVVNSFTELEAVHLSYLKTQLGHDRVWAVGPLAPLNKHRQSRQHFETSLFSRVMAWLDERPTGSHHSVIYVCFGSRTILTRQQMEALSTGLDRSGVDFILCVGSDPTVDVPEGYEERVAGRGFVIRGWAPQVAILSHRAVGSFVTHCGWNSVLEGVSAGVAMLTWPMGAEQFVNARLLVDELGAGMRFSESGVKAPGADEVAQLAREAVRGRGVEIRKRAVEMRAAALTAVNGGSTKMAWDDLAKSLSRLGSGF
uniref:Uncharacterized protein n=1 Tax=Kalanchoe fedtschenkoi TaxID=63787 RepID=A0A7N0R862_KALFE